MPGRRYLIAALSAALFAAGCGTTRSPHREAAASDTVAGTPTPAVSPVASEASAAVEAIPEKYDPSRDAAADIRAALTRAAGDHREVLIDFGADWCPDCVVLDKMFHSAQVAPLLQKDYHVVKVDVGEFDRNLDVAAKYLNLKTSGIPALVVLGSDGSVRVATNDGAFANARSMDEAQVKAFLTRWAPTGAR